MVIKDDQINIKLIPTESKCKLNVKVEISYHGKKLTKSPISKVEYDDIKIIIKNIDRNDLIMPRIVNKGKADEHLVGIADGGHNSIKIYENGSETEYYTTGFSQEYHKTFYFAVEKIFKTLNIELKNL